MVRDKVMVGDKDRVGGRVVHFTFCDTCSPKKPASPQARILPINGNESGYKKQFPQPISINIFGLPIKTQILTCSAGAFLPVHSFRLLHFHSSRPPLCLSHRSTVIMNKLTMQVKIRQRPRAQLYNAEMIKCLQNSNFRRLQNN